MERNNNSSNARNKNLVCLTSRNCRRFFLLSFSLSRLYLVVFLFLYRTSRWLRNVMKEEKTVFFFVLTTFVSTRPYYLSAINKALVVELSFHSAFFLCYNRIVTRSNDKMFIWWYQIASDKKTQRSTVAFSARSVTLKYQKCILQFYIALQKLILCGKINRCEIVYKLLSITRHIALFICTPFCILCDFN